MVTLTVSKEPKALSGHDVTFLMDTGAECSLLPLDVYKRATRFTLEIPQCSQKISHLSAVAGSRTADSVVGTTKDAAALPLVRYVHIVKRRIILLSSAQQKARCLLSKSDSI